MISKTTSCFIILIGICTQEVEQRLKEGQEKIMLAIEDGQRKILSVRMCNGSCSRLYQESLG